MLIMNSIHWLFFTLLCTFFIISTTTGYKILIFAPGHSNSQLLYHFRFGDMVASHGHDVTVYVAHYNQRATAPSPKLAKVIYFQAMPDQDQFQRMNERFQSQIFTPDFSWFSYMRSYADFFQIFVKGCETQTNSKKLFRILNETKFDVAIAHMYDYCPMGIIHALKIPAYIWMSSGQLLDTMAWSTGVPSPWSYVPNSYSVYSDRMTFVERLKNFIGNIFYHNIHWYSIVRPENAIFKRRFGANFPNLENLAGHASLVFVNADEMLEFPRPILHKVVYIGGAHVKQSEPLDPEWRKAADQSGDGFFVVSFGSVANVSAMPAQWKDHFLQAFSTFPTYKFIWKYDNRTAADSGRHKNVIFTELIPQRDLLGHPKFRGLITHCGYSSFIEAATFGAPIIAVPLFNDQTGNRRRAERLGMAIGIDRKSLSAKRLESAIKEILENRTYRLNAQRVSRQLANKPVKSEQLALGWIEYLAEFQNLTNLQPTSIDLNLIQYFMVDVVLTLVAGLSIVLYVTLCTIHRLIKILLKRRQQTVMVSQDIPLEEKTK